jgi:UDP:flavonoid glycosyltransferase YjiC (YdhE family)
VPCLYGFSPSLIPVPRDWHGAGTVCGYWFLDTDGSWSPPSDLEDFLAAGPPPLYVGFGSMASEDPGRTAGVVLGALQRTGRRAILASGWGGLRSSELPPTVKAVDFVPHDWLFSRVCGAVHHGGAGTTAAALRAGIPSVIVPFFADQFFWAARLNALGMSPPGVPQRELTVDSLAEAIRAITVTPDMRDRCRGIARAIRSERGAETAASAADRYLRSVIPARIH